MRSLRPSEHGRRQATSALQGLACSLAASPEQLVKAASKRAAAVAPDHVRVIHEAGEDLVTVSRGLVAVLLASLQQQGDPLFLATANEVRSVGRRRCAQGLPLEALAEWWLAHKAVVMESLEAAAHGHHLAEEILFAAERRLDAEFEQLNLHVTRGYFDYMKERYEEERAELQALIRIARAVNQSLEVADVAEAGLAETVQAMGLESGVFIVAAPDGRLHLAHAVGLTPDELQAAEKHDLRRHRLIARAAASALPEQANFHPRSRAFGGQRSAFAVGLRSKGELLGVLSAGTRRQRFFTQAELEFVAAVADHVALALEHAREHRREARTDYLTGLANRPEFERAMRREVAAAQRHGRPLTLMLMDLDQLKKINDTFGHHAGDEAIRAVAEALRRVVRATDTSARIGGDEFALAIPGAALPHAREVVERLESVLAEVGDASRLPMPIELSFGLATWVPGLEAADLFALADEELYRDKRSRVAGRRARPATQQRHAG